MNTGNSGLRVQIECVEGSHYAPEGWDDVEVAICPRCSQTVRWNAATDTWDTDTTLRVLVLEPTEARFLVQYLNNGLHPVLLGLIVNQLDLQEPVE